MKLVQKLLSHGLLISFFAASFFTYLYRAELFPQWFGDTTRTAAISDESQSRVAPAPPQPPAGSADSSATVGSQSAVAPGVIASGAAVMDDLPPLRAPKGETPTSDTGGMQDATSDLPPLVSASDVDQLPSQPPAAATDAAASAPEPAAAIGFSAERAWDNATPPPVRFRPLDAQQPDTAAPLPGETTVQDAAVAPLAVPENIAPPQDTAPVYPAPVAAEQTQSEPVTSVNVENAAAQVKPQSPTEPAAAVGFSAERAWDNATPPPARFRPLDAQQPDTAAPLPGEATVQDAAVAPLAVPENIAPPQDAAPVYPAPVAAEQAQSEPVTSVNVENAAAQVKPQSPTEPAAAVGFSAERAWDNATPPPARYRPLDAQQPDTAAPLPGEATVQDAAVAPLAATQVKPRPPTEPAATVRPDAVPVQAEAPGAAPASGAQEFQQQLAVARSYFWRRDVRGALQAYQNLARAWPAQADAWGELGNLYLRIGNRPAAAEAYYRTMSLLLDQGEAARAHDLLEVLYGLDAARASEIEKRFRQVSS